MDKRFEAEALAEGLEIVANPVKDTMYAGTQYMWYWVYIYALPHYSAIQGCQTLSYITTEMIGLNNERHIRAMLSRLQSTL